MTKPLHLQPAWTGNFISHHDLVDELFHSIHSYISDVHTSLEKVEDCIDDLELMRQFLPESRMEAIEVALKDLTEKLMCASKPIKHKKKLTNPK